MTDAAVEKQWSKVVFGDLVEKVSHSGVPTSDESRTYIGLEHFDPDSFAITRWGTDVDIKVPKTRVKSGDVLFARRNTHLRRVAVAPFDTYFSPDGYAFRSRSPRLLQDLLLYLVASDYFMDFAIEHSAGTHSKRVKWTDLAKYEFTLPPMEMQQRIARVLGATRVMTDAHVHLSDASLALRKSFEAGVLVGRPMETVMGHYMIEDVRLPRDWQLVEASTLCAAPVTSGITPRNGEVNPDYDCPFIKVGDLAFDGLLHFGAGGSRLNRQAFESTRSHHVVPGDILTNIVGPPLGKVSVVPDDVGEALINQAIVRYRPIDAEIGTWLRAYLMSPWAKRWLFLRSKKTSGQRNINATTCAALPVPLPPMSQIPSLTAGIEEIWSLGREVDVKQAHARQLLKVMLQKTVSG